MTDFLVTIAYDTAWLWFPVVSYLLLVWEGVWVHLVSPLSTSQPLLFTLCINAIYIYVLCINAVYIYVLCINVPQPEILYK